MSHPPRETTPPPLSSPLATQARLDLAERRLHEMEGALQRHRIASGDMGPGALALWMLAFFACLCGLGVGSVISTVYGLVWTWRTAGMP